MIDDVTDTEVDPSIPVATTPGTPLIYQVSPDASPVAPCVTVTGSVDVIDTNGTTLITVPLSRTAGPEITFDTPIPVLIQGQTVTVGFRARSGAAGAKKYTVNVGLIGSAAGSVDIDIPPAGTVSAQLPVTVPRNVPGGNTYLEATIQGTFLAEVPVTIAPAQVTVDVVNSSAIDAKPGTAVPVDILLSLNETTSNTTVVFEPYASPFASFPGQTFELNNTDWMQNGIPYVWHERNVDASGAHHGQITLTIPSGTPGCGDNFPVRIKWSAHGGKQTGELALTLTVPYQEVTLYAPIETGGLAALGVHVWVTLRGDGTVEWKGHAHDSGLDGYDFTINAIVPDQTGIAVALTHSGHVGGTITPGQSDHDWNETPPIQPLVRDKWATLSKAQLQTNIEYTSDIGQAFESLLDLALKTAISEAFPGGGALIFIGTEVGSLFATGSLVPGARLVGPILWLAGPANTLFAVTANTIAGAGSSERGVQPEEYAWANNEVFGGALPPRDDLRITDTIGAGNRAFTFPRYDLKTTLNLGHDGYSAIYDGVTAPLASKWYQHQFLHELVHACQIAHSHNLSYLTTALAASGSYAYGPPGPDYSSFNFEQQAQIVADWWLGKDLNTSQTSGNQSPIPKDTNSPYFRYVLDARLGRFGWENW